jgi:hypothetical protein
MGIFFRVSIRQSAQGNWSRLIETHQSTLISSRRMKSFRYVVLNLPHSFPGEEIPIVMLRNRLLRLSPVLRICRCADVQAPPEPKYVAFQGTGRALGSSSTADPPAAPPAAVPVSREPSNQPLQGLVVDDTKSATSIQLRLQDGTRLVARFNHSHTIADIRGFIDAARPGYSGPYSLQSMGFPPKQLTDANQTIEEAGLVNAVVIQK